MNQYLLLIQGNAKIRIPAAEWDRFNAAAKASGMFKGGSEVGSREVLGDTQTVRPTKHIVGYMRFDSDDKAKLLELLQSHPVVVHGGSVELCELPKS
jgi:hypothetical protein